MNAISIAGYAEHDEGFTEYSIAIPKEFCGGASGKTVMHRYSDFLTLHRNVRRELKIPVPMPPKRWYHSASVKRGRVTKLSNYLQGLLAAPGALRMKPVLEFLELSFAAVSRVTYRHALGSPAYPAARGSVRSRRA